MGKKINSKSIALMIVLLLLLSISFMPFYVMMVNSTLNANEVLSGIHLFPGKYFLTNLLGAIKKADLLTGFKNSLTITISFVVISGYFGTVAAYGFAMYDFRFKKILFFILLSTLMIPAQLSIVGYYDFISKMKLVNSFVPLIIPGFGRAISIFFIKQYMESSISRSLIESARIDGANEFRIFNSIVFPLVIPAVATMSIFAFVGSWNAYLTPLVLLRDPGKMTIPLKIQVALTNISQLGITTPELYAAIAVTVVPVMIAFVFLSKKIVGGLTSGGVKG